MKILFVASFAPIVADPKKSRALYADALGVSFEHEMGEYAFTQALGGVKHFGLWPLHEAAEACFGTSEWPREIPIPQASLEFEVEDVAAAAKELEAKGHRLLHGVKTEPWGQTLARLLSPEGLLLAVCHSPMLHGDKPG